ncbi:MAG: TetR/AcrR family transcriptional regulator [Jannaschia sp.]
MKVSAKVAVENRARILAAADRLIRRDGMAQASIARIADAAGLTHGALYRHFADKDALAAEAVAAGFGPILSRLGEMPAGTGAAPYAALYLSPDHRDHFPWGCPVAALAHEIHRHPPVVAEAFVDGVERNLEAIARLLDGPEARARAIVTLSLLSGALSLARAAAASGDLALSSEILSTVRASILQAEAMPPATGERVDPHPGAG